MPTPLEHCRDALTRNGFEVFLAQTPGEAGQIFTDVILPTLKVSTASWGDSMTMTASGALDVLAQRPDITLIRTFEEGLDRRVILERRRQALLVDLFLTGANAVTLGGQVLNLDMIGNRTAAITFGPKKVVLFVGRNKLTATLEEGMARVRQSAAPRNAARHDFPTPCARTGRCHDCNAPKRICNTWSILEKCFPPGRIKVVLIDQDLGL